MNSVIDQFYLRQSEPLKSYYLALRSIISKIDDEMDERFKYGVPYFYFKNKPFCYFWRDKNTMQPYIGFGRSHLIEHKALSKDNRKKIKVLHLRTEEDIPVELIYAICKLLMPLY